MYATKRISSRKRHIAPAIIAGGIGLVSNIIGNIMSNNRANKERKRAESDNRRSLFNEQLYQDKQDFEISDKDGLDNIEYYNKGGNLKELIKKNLKNKPSINGGKYETKGGKLVEIDKDVDLAVGNKHSEKNIDNTYGIKLIKNGKEEAEIEDGEVIVDDQVVFSDQLMYDNKKSFADKMIDITKERKRYETKLAKTRDKKNRNTLENKLADLNMAEESLFKEQEIKKYNKGDKTLNDLKGKYNLGGFLKELAPSLIDNVGNMFLTKKTPKISSPVLRKAKSLKTDINVNPQLANIRRITKSISDNIINNTSSSANARNSIASAKLRGLEEENKIQGNKENIETQLKNKDSINKQNVSNSNTDIINNNLMANYKRANDIQSRISANFANLGKDIGGAIMRQSEGDVEDEKLVTELLDDKTGAKLRSIDDNPYIQKRIKNNKVLRDFINSLKFKNINNNRLDFKSDDASIYSTDYSTLLT